MQFGNNWYIQWYHEEKQPCYYTTYCDIEYNTPFGSKENCRDDLVLTPNSEVKKTKEKTRISKTILKKVRGRSIKDNVAFPWQ